MKKIIKNVIIIFMVFYMLLSCAFLGVSYAEGEDPIELTPERLGNFVSNFAINFYENWSNPSKKQKKQIEKSAEHGNGESDGDKTTAYNSGASYNVNPDVDVYEFSNGSWIKFVYFNAIKNKFPTGAIADDGQPNDAAFQNEEDLFGENLKKISSIIDIEGLIADGKIKAGDILKITDGKGGTSFALYVGGAKVIYATEDAENGLRYEFLQHYLRTIRNNLEGKNTEGGTDITKTENKGTEKLYGVTNVYRIKDDFIKNHNITQSDTNLYFNNRGYFNYSEYNGIPKEVTYLGMKTGNDFTWIIDSISGVFKFMVNLVIYVVRMTLVGYASLFENIIQSIMLGITGNNNDGTIVEKFFGPNGASQPGNRMSMESVIFNQIPILDANFFNTKTAGGKNLTIEKEFEKPAAIGSGTYVTEVEDKDNFVYKAREKLKKAYNIVLNAAIAVMLFVLIALGIKAALNSTSPAERAKYRSLLLSWAFSFLVILLIHVFMYLILSVNDMLVDVSKDMSSKITSSADSLGINGSEKIDNSTNVVSEKDGYNSQEEMNMYDAVRTRAYSWNASVGFPALILYVFLIYLLIKFIIIYAKRALTIYVLAILGPISGCMHAIDTILGRQTKSLGEWFKKFAGSVFLQSIHAFIYVVYVSLAIRLSQANLTGFAVCIMVLITMLNIDKIVKKIYSLGRIQFSNPFSGGVFGYAANGNYEPSEKVKSIANFTNNVLYGQNYFYKQGVNAVKEKLGDVHNSNIRFIKGIGTGIGNKIGDGINDAKIGVIAGKFKINEKISKTIANTKAANWLNQKKAIQFLRDKGKSIREMKEKLGMAYQSEQIRALAGGSSKEIKRAIYKSMKLEKELNRMKFKRHLGTAKDIAIGVGGMAISGAVAVINPKDGLNLFIDSRRRIAKYTASNVEKLTFATSINKTKMDKMIAEQKYNNLLDRYVESQSNYEAEMDNLRSLRDNEADEEKRAEYQTQMEKLTEKRNIESAEELKQFKRAHDEKVKANKAYRDAVKEHVSTSVKYTGNKLEKAVSSVEDGLAFVAGINSDKEEIDKKQYEEKVKKLDEEVKKAKETLKKETEREYERQEERKEEKIKEEIDELHEEIEELNKEKEEIQETKEINKVKVRANDIRHAVNKYMQKNKIEEVTPEAIANVLELIKDDLDTDGHTYVKITASVKAEVKRKLQEGIKVPIMKSKYGSKDIELNKGTEEGRKKGMYLNEKAEDREERKGSSNKSKEVKDGNVMEIINSMYKNSGNSSAQKSKSNVKFGSGINGISYGKKYKMQKNNKKANKRRK